MEFVGPRAHSPHRAARPGGSAAVCSCTCAAEGLGEPPGADRVRDHFLGFQQAQILTVPVDGRGGVRQLVPGTHNWLGCQSADGRKMTYRSDQEAPHEYFLYLANADGTHAEKVTETKVTSARTSAHNSQPSMT
jgi:hypothetical protein